MMLHRLAGFVEVLFFLKGKVPSQGAKSMQKMLLSVSSMGKNAVSHYWPLHLIQLFPWRFTVSYSFNLSDVIFR